MRRDFSEANCRVGSDWSLVVTCLQPGEVLHQLRVQVGIVELGGEKQHSLHRLFPDGRVGVHEAGDHVRKHLRVNHLRV